MDRTQSNHYWTDPYWKLKPAPTTPPEEICECDEVKAMVLQFALTDNPLACATCRRELPPERIGLGAELAEQIAHWCSTYGSLYRLWLDSGEYEQWAAERMADPNGQVNVEGHQIVQRLNDLLPTYLLWFHPDPLGIDINECPRCGCELDPTESSWLSLCEKCRIVV